MASARSVSFSTPRPPTGPVMMKCWAACAEETEPRASKVIVDNTAFTNLLYKDQIFQYVHHGATMS